MLKTIILGIQPKWSKRKMLGLTGTTMIENSEPTSSPEEVIKELQVVYVEVRCSVSAMVERCQEEGWIP
jgi:hypothetical protein